MEEKDGLIVYQEKMYNLDMMSELEMDALIDQIEKRQEELENKILKLIDNEV